jgi:hypothetical protein
MSGETNMKEIDLAKLLGVDVTSDEYVIAENLTHMQMYVFSGTKEECVKAWPKFGAKHAQDWHSIWHYNVWYKLYHRKCQ